MNNYERLLSDIYFYSGEYTRKKDALARAEREGASASQLERLTRDLEKLKARLDSLTDRLPTDSTAEN